MLICSCDQPSCCGQYLWLLFALCPLSFNCTAVFNTGKYSRTLLSFRFVHIGIALNFLFYFMGVVTSPAVVPVSVTLWVFASPLPLLADMIIFFA